MAHSTRPCFPRSSHHAITRAHLLIHIWGSPTPWPLQETSALRTLLSRDSLLFKEDGLARLKRKGVCVSTYREEKPQPTVPKEDKHQSPRIKENASSSSCKEEESCKTSSRTSGASSSWAPDSTSSKKSSHWGKCSPPAKKQPDNCNTEDHHTSSKHKDRFCSDRSRRCGSDKESSNTPPPPHKHVLSPLPCAFSTECPQKEPHVDEPSHTPGESSHTSHRSPSRSMSELEDHRPFTVPTSSSTQNKLRIQLCHQSSSTDSRLSMMPLDMGLYKSFRYYGPLVSAEVGPHPWPEFLGHSMSPAAYGSPLD